jgi:hypothetical protein
LLFHPRLLQRTCALCQRWLYDDEHSVLTRGGQRICRPPGSPTPCWKCPKQSPAHAAGYERDLDRIVRVVELYHRVRATAGRCLSDREAHDPLTTRYLAIVDRLVRQLERARKFPEPRSGDIA